MSKRFSQVHDGEWIKPTPQKGHLLKCCDCGLVHVVDFRVVKGKVLFRPKRDNRRTANVRRKMK